MEIKINTLLNQGELSNFFNSDNSIAIVIDVLRASTTICAALYNGAKEIIPFRTIKEANEFKKRFERDPSTSLRVTKNILLCGERNGIKPEGFDLGNSPSEYSKERVENKTVLLTTTNGTLALERIKNAKMVLIGCFANISSIETILKKISSEFTDIILLCAGNDEKPTLEDTLCAGAFIYKLVNRYENCYLNDDSKIAVKSFLEMKDNLLGECYNSEHGKRLIELGFKDDIDLALKYDIYPVVPVFKVGRIEIPFSSPLA